MEDNLQTINLKQIRSLEPIVDEYGIGDDFILGEASGERVQQNETLLKMLRYPIRFDGYIIFFLKKGHLRADVNLNTYDIEEHSLLISVPGNIIRVADYREERVKDIELTFVLISREFMSMDDITGGEIYLGLAESHLISYIAGAIKQLKETYPGLHYQIVSGDTEQVIDKLNKGILDFAVLAEEPDESRYESIVFPEADIWGLIMPADDSLSKKKSVRVNDLIGLPLFCSDQAWANDIPGWAGDDFGKLRLEGSFKLSYNASVFAKEKLGYLLTFDKLIDTSESSGLCFRPLSPRLETRLYLIWKKNQTFSPMAERFLMQMQSTLLR